MDKRGHIDWDDMNALLAFSATGSTARAGRALGISHQTVARRITRLEARLGAALVDRGKVLWTLTETGATVAGNAAQMARIMARTCALTQPEAGGLSGKVSIAGPRWAVTLAVLPAMASLSARHPQLTYDLLPEAADMADLRLISARAMPPGLPARRIAVLSAALYGTPQAVARMERALTTGAACGLDAFTQARPHLVVQESDSRGDGNITRVADFDTLVEAVRLGIGVAVLPDAVGRTLPGIVACRAITLPHGPLALWCLCDRDGPRATLLRALEREIFRACRPMLPIAA